MDRVFLDANVLFSAAYREDSGLGALWSAEDVTLLSCEYAVEGARRNVLLTRPSAAPRLDNLVASIDVVQTILDLPQIPDTAALPTKDRPILASAIASRATHLVTGDRSHFGALYGQRIGGAIIVTPASYLATRKR